MPPRRQPSTRETAATIARKTTRTASSTRNVRRADAPEPQDGVSKLAHDFEEKLAIVDKAKQRAPTIGRATRAASSRVVEESASSTQDNVPDVKGELKAPAKSFSVRRPRAQARTKARAADDSESLAAELGAKLTVTSKSIEQQSVDAMRAVNVASRSLTAVMESGWTMSSGSETSVALRKTSKPPSSTYTASTVREYVAAAKQGLQTLRKLKPGDWDVERAASSILSKSIALEMYDYSLDALDDMHSSIIALYDHGAEQISKPTSIKSQLLSLPLPTTLDDCSDVLLTLLSTYLLHSLTAVSYTLFNDTHDATHTDLEEFRAALHTTDTLIRWLPYFKSLPTKHLDSILTRAYTVLAKSSQMHVVTPHTATAVYRIRAYSLLCLVHTTPGVLEPSTFWSQTVKFTVSYVTDTNQQLEPSGTAPPDHEISSDTMQTVSSTFAELIGCAEKRADKAKFMGGRGFVIFCEYWTSFAQRTNDISVLKRIRELMQNIELTAPSPTPCSAFTAPNTPMDAVQAVKSHNRSRYHAASEYSVETAQLYALFVEATTVLEHPDRTKETKCLDETLKAMERCDQYLRISYAGVRDGRDAEEEHRSADKVKRAFERLRRAAVKVIEASAPSRHLSPQDLTVRPLVIAILQKGVDIMETLIRTVPHHDLLTAALDSLFTLARTSLMASNPSTFTEAYNYLSRSSSLVPTESESEEVMSHANFVRCISGAFHNLAATLYQATRFDFAVRFLNQSCALGELALRMYRASRAHEDSHVVDEKSDESWAQLEDQLWRRWEILGVCHSKTEDRKHAFQAFVNCVKTFPFHRYGFPELASGFNTASFSISPQLKHLGVIIDRLTYGGLCDLYLEPRAVSLKAHLKDVFVSYDGVNPDEIRRTIVGALVERQIESLEGSKWKPSVRKAIEFFLSELLDAYEPLYMPLRRARVLLKFLEMAYHAHDGSEANSFDNIHIGDIAAEADKLLTIEDPQWDQILVRSQPYYCAILNLWLALLVHRSAQTSLFSRVVTYADEACGILKALTSSEPRTSAAKDSPPHTRGGSKTATGARNGASRPAARSRTRTAKTGALAVPITPKRKTSRTVAAHAITVLPSSKSDSGQTPENSEFEGMPQLVDLLRTTAQLLGLLGQVITKVRLLLQARRLCERLVRTRPDDYVKISVDLAHEYIKLGKTEKGANVYKHTLNMVKNLSLSEETRALYLLRYSESLAVTGNVLKSSTAYCDACNLSDSLPDIEKGMTTVQRVTMRSACLERGAIAASTFADIQYSRDDPATSINGLLQSLRLWNRAFDTLARLVPPPPTAKVSDGSDNPFLTDEAKASAGSQGNGHSESPPPSTKFQRPPALNGLEWRIAEGLLGAMFSLVQAYLARGSPREAEYFAHQAKDLAESLNAPAMASRALARAGEIQLHVGLLEESHASLTRAAELAVDTAGPDTAEVRRLLAEHSRRNADDKEAQQLYAEAIHTLEELDNLFVTLDGASTVPRKSLSSAPQTMDEAVAPEVLVAILRQNIWLLYGEGEEYQSLLERFRSIPANAETKGEQDALLAKLTLESVYSLFQADMFLSSLTESTITLPMGKAQESISLPASRHEILGVLANAEKLFWSDLALVARRGRVFHVRDAAISLALIRALQVSLGKTSIQGPVLAAGLLDAATAITLRREMLEVIQHKFPDVDYDDLQWPLITTNGSPLPPQRSRNKLRFNIAHSQDADEDVFEEKSMKEYWNFIKKKYEAYVCDAARLAQVQANELPPNWTVINISMTDDKNTMFVSRQRPNREPLIVCIPLKGRRESDEDEQLTFDDAIVELKDIIQLSDEGTRQASNVRNDRERRAAWWADRAALDKRLKELLENIEFCWLGAFKAALSPPINIPEDLLSEFRTSLEQVFERSIVLRDKRQKTLVRLEDSLVECLASLSPKCRDEELEDVVYFILDLYQFHGIPVASAEVDIDQAVIDVRAVLEEFLGKSQNRIVVERDPHMFLVLDKNVQGIPWESIPILRGRSVSRIPSMDFLLDRLEYSRWSKGSPNSNQPADRVAVDPRKVFYVLNPSGDLKNTEGRFVDWLKTMKNVGWDGVTGRPPSEQQFTDALSRKDLVLYFGHGGAEQYIRSRKVRHLPRCAATMLWGCSSGALKEMGDFDRTGTPHNYMLAGCPTLVANLWDVTDRDIDKFAQSVFDKMSLNAERVHDWQEAKTAGGTSIVTALGQSRESCKLKYLTGAAPVIYGIPFYL